MKKDVDIARRYYMQAAERGNAKAMHNLAVLDADGGGKGANYKSASQWFRKAADRGVADSQFNLGILYARGIGVEQNLAESFKWFSLAAAQGDADAARKRDDVAKRLDAQSLAAAKLAIQTFTPEPQPDDAINVATPAGGWDTAPGPTSTAKPAAKPVSIKRAARLISIVHHLSNVGGGPAAKKAAGRGFFSPSPRSISVMQGRASPPDPRSSRNHAMSGFGRPQAQSRSERACSFIFRSPTFRSMSSSSWRWARRSVSCPGMFGIGGGFLMTPLLIFIGIAPAVAVASVASHIAASSFSGAISYWRRRAIDPALALVLLCGGTVGTALGVWTFTLLRSLGQLDLMIALSYVVLLTTVGGLMFWEGLRAMLRVRARQRGAAAPVRQPWLDPRPAAEDALQALQDLPVGDPRGRRRRHHRLHRRRDGHRRRLHPGPDHDLSAAGADLDRDRHLDGADAGHHDVRHPAARRHQPSGRCRAGADPDDRRRHRRAVRRPRRPDESAANICGCCSGC